MKTVILKYDPPPAAQPEVNFAFGLKSIKIKKGEEVTAAADLANLPAVPPGITISIPGAEPPRPSRVLAAKRGEKFVPARRVAPSKDDTKTGKDAKDGKKEKD